MNVNIVVKLTSSGSSAFLSKSKAMATYLPGTICSVRGSAEEWQIIGTRYDGLVHKYVVQSRNSGEIRCLFNFEVFERNTSTYQEINDFFKKNTGIGLDENFDFLDEEMDEISTETINSAEFLEVSGSQTKIAQNKRFKSLSEDTIVKLKQQNTEKTTDNSTKWAVGLLKGRFIWFKLIK